MSADARQRLSVRVAADYANAGHRKYFIPDLNDVANVVGEAVAADTDALAASAAAAASYAAMLAIAGGTQGIGGDPSELPLVAFLGSAAFASLDAVIGVAQNVQNGAYQILATDRAKLLLSTSGANTWTLPLSTDCPPFYYFRWRNRSGSNLIFNRTSPDTIEGATTAWTMATNTSGIISLSAGNWERA